MQSVPNTSRSFSSSKKQSKPVTVPPSELQSLIKNNPLFKFKFSVNCSNQSRIIKAKHYDSNHHQQQKNLNLKTMATLQRFKLLATQCGVTQSPTRSPRTSPLVNLRRRKTTLRMLLGRSRSSSCRSPPRRRDSASAVAIAAATATTDRFRLERPPEKIRGEKEKEKALAKRNSLKELFVSSPPFEVEGGGRRNLGENIVGSEDSSILVGKVAGAGLTGLQAGPGSPRPVWTGFRYRSLLRRAWRPVLLSIPE